MPQTDEECRDRVATVNSGRVGIFFLILAHREVFQQGAIHLTPLQIFKLSQYVLLYDKLL